MKKENEPTKVLLHCSASPDTEDGSVYFGADDLEDYHTNELGWMPPFGYHWYITRDGTLHQGRDEEDRGAHEETQNSSSIGVCYEGTRLPTLAQIRTLCDLYRQIKSIHGFQYSEWFGHYQFDENKDCPGFDIEEIKAIFRKLPT